MSEDIKIERNIPEETLLKALEGAERIDNILILITTKDGDFEYLTNTSSMTTKFGLLEFCKAILQAKLLKED